MLAWVLIAARSEFKSCKVVRIAFRYEHAKDLPSTDKVMGWMKDWFDEQVRERG